jgi:hypothetical protein
LIRDPNLSVFQALQQKQAKVSGKSSKKYGLDRIKNLSIFDKKYSNNHHLPIIDQLSATNQNINNNGIQQPPLSSFHSSINFNFSNIQTKLKVSQPGDKYEREADYIAQKIVPVSQTSAPSTSSTSANVVNEKTNDSCKYCEEEIKENRINIKISKGDNLDETFAAKVQDITNSMSNGGSLLDQSTRKFMESRFDFDFSSVRIHSDETAADAAEAVNARAFTIGNHIVFGKDQYTPKTIEGKLLLAHELAHAIQQQYSELRPRLGIRLSPLSTQLLQRQKVKDPKDTEPQILKDFAAKFPTAANLVRKSPSAMLLVNEADKASAKFGGYAEEGPAKNAWAYTVGDKVYVPKSQTDAVLAMKSFLFELNNAIRKPKFAELDKEAVKGTKGKLTAKQFSYNTVELEVEGMLRIGELWFEMKKTIGKGSEWNKYDHDFYLSEYQEFKKGKKTKDDIVKNVLYRKYTAGKNKGKTVEQYYMEQYELISGGK